MPKVSTLKALYDNQKAADEWLNLIPNEVSDAFFDTPYIDGLYKNNEILMTELFGIHIDAVDWLLYEWKEGLSCGIDGQILDIDTPEDYYSYLIEYEGWEE